MTETTTKKQSLFDIGADFEALEALLAELDGDISDPKAQEIVSEWFGEIEQNLGDKGDNYIWIIKKWEGEKAVGKSEMDRIRMRQEVLDNRIESLKKRMQDFMEFTGRTLIETTKGRKIAIQNNGGVKPIAVQEDIVIAALEASTGGEAVIDPIKALAFGVTAELREAIKPYLRVTVELDRKKLREDLEAGKTVPFAHLEERGKGLRIR